MKWCLVLNNAPRQSFASLARVGVIDVGSNSVRLVVFDGAARSPAYFYNEKILCGLGKGLADTGILNPEGRDRALRAIRRFKKLCKIMDLQSLEGVATAAVREARDGPDFCATVKQQTGIALQVASGAQEARLSAQGVLLGWPDANGLVCDIGGASMEIAEVNNGAVGRCETSPLGPLVLNELQGGPDALDLHIRKTIQTLRQKMPDIYQNLFLVGGSYRAIARLDMERRNYPLKVLHEYTMTPEDLYATLNWIDSLTLEDMLSMTDTSVERLTLVPVAARVLLGLINEFAPKSIAVSSYGIREGILYEKMPPELRRRDPLREACLSMEAASARFPGFGLKLAEWLSPLYRDSGPGMQRLVMAACLLHDVTWKAHPDYRAEVCFDNATRANLGGLDHHGRVFLGMALLHRYKSDRGSSRFGFLATILSQEDQTKAEALGKAMRVGALLGGAEICSMGQLICGSSELILQLHPEQADILGEVVQKRLEALGSVIGKSVRIVTVLPSS